MSTLQGNSKRKQNHLTANTIQSQTAYQPDTWHTA